MTGHEAGADVDAERLRQRCVERLRELRIPQPFDLAELCAAVAARRGRPIRLLPMRLPAGGPCGLWIAGERQDYIVYEQATTRLHQEHIILHEIGHLIWAHPGPPALGDDHARAVFPHLDADVVRKVLARTRYSTAEEREAEMVASLILEKAERPAGRPRPVDAETAAILARLEASMNPTRPGRDG